MRRGIEGDKKRVLWVTFHFPPRQSGGVFRPIKIYKYLDRGKFDIDFITISLTSKYGKAVRDDTLLEEVFPKPATYRIPSIEPDDFLRGGREGAHSKEDPTGLENKSRSPGSRSETPRPGIKKRILKNLYGLFIMVFYFPDQFFLWGVLSSLKSLRLYFKRRYDLIYTTSNPPSGHLPGIIFKALGVKWVADFRDGGNLWNKNLLGYPKGKVRQWVDFYYQKYVLDKSDYVVTQSELLKRDLGSVYSIKHSRLRAIPNGYDEADFTNVSSHPSFVKKADEIHALHVGTWVLNSIEIERIIHDLNALQSALKAKGAGLCLHAVGNDLFSEEQKTSALRFQYLYHGVIPHPLLIPYLLAADCYLLSASVGLLVEGAEGVLPGKLWEYLRGGKPILLFGPKDEAWQIVVDAGVGFYLGTLENEHSASADELLRLIQKAKGVHPQVHQHSWESRARAMREVFDTVLA